MEDTTRDAMSLPNRLMQRELAKNPYFANVTIDQVEKARERYDEVDWPDAIVVSKTSAGRWLRQRLQTAAEADLLIDQAIVAFAHLGREWPEDPFPDPRVVVQMFLGAVVDYARECWPDLFPRGKRPIPRDLQRKILERDFYRCVWCGTHLDLSVDHIIPESLGGVTEADNLRTLCRPCNSRKGATIGDVRNN